MSNLNDELFEILMNDAMPAARKVELVRKILEIDKLYKKLNVKKEFQLNLRATSGLLHPVDRKQIRVEHNALSYVVSKAVSDATIPLVHLFVQYGYDTNAAFFFAAFHRAEKVLYSLLFTMHPNLDYVGLPESKGTTTRTLINQYFPKLLSANYKLNQALRIHDAEPSKNADAEFDISSIQVKRFLIGAYANDPNFVMEYLIFCLKDIALGPLGSGKSHSHLPFFTSVLCQYQSLVDDDPKVKTLFDDLFAVWAKYVPAENGFFADSKAHQQFLKATFKRLPEVPKLESKGVLVTVGGEVKHAEEKSVQKNYFEQFHSLTKAEQEDIVKTFRQESKGEGFNQADFLVAFPEMASSFNLAPDLYKIVMVGPGSPFAEWHLHEQLEKPLRTDASYLLFSLPTGDSEDEQTGLGHATAVVVDRRKRAIHFADPAGNRFNAEKEGLSRISGTQKILDELKPFRVVSPKKYQNIPQTSAADKDCLPYSMIIMLASLLKLENVPLVSSVPGAQTVLNSLAEIDVFEGRMPKKEFIHSYLGAFLLAKRNSKVDLTRELEKQFEAGASMVPRRKA